MNDLENILELYKSEEITKEIAIEYIQDIFIDIAKNGIKNDRITN